MSTPEPRSRSWIAHALEPGRHGAPGPSPVLISEMVATVVQLTERRDQRAQLAEAMRASFSLALPGPGRAHFHGTFGAIAIAPATWLLLAPRGADASLLSRLQAAVGAAGSLVDQTWGKTALRISGTHARDVLMKGCRIDLHPRCFSPGRAAATPIAHVNTVLYQIDERPTYDLIVPATLAETFAEWLTASAAEFGFEVASALPEGP